MAELIVFDIFSDFAHFKRPYTTTSPVTFPLPSKPTLYGMMGAIIGLDKDSYLEHFYDRGVKVGLQIKNPIHKIYIAENLINTKDGMAKIKTRTQIKIEFLKNAAYRVYVSHPDEALSSRLLENLSAHKSHYTFSMGLSECLGNFQFVGHFHSQTVDREDCALCPEEIKQKLLRGVQGGGFLEKNPPGRRRQNKTQSGDYVEIHSVVPTEALVEDDDSVVKFEPGKEIFRVSLTAEMNPDREIQRMMDIVFERNGKPIRAKVKNYEQIPELNENILLF